MTRREAKRLRGVVEQAVQSLDDKTAIQVIPFYPRFEDLIGIEVNQGFKFRYNDKLWRTEQPTYTFVDTYIPGDTGTESLFSEINETNEGSIDSPIPYNNNMELMEGLYYVQNDVIYRCTRSTGQPVYHDLSALVGLYVEQV